MPRPKGSKNKATLEKLRSVDAEIAELNYQKKKLENAQEKLIAKRAEISTAIKENKKELTVVNRKLGKLEEKKAEADATIADNLAREEIQKRISALIADGKSAEDILSMMQ